MADPNDAAGTTRRRFIVGAAGLAAGGAVDARADNAKNFRPTSLIGHASSAKASVYEPTAIPPNTKRM